MAFKSAERFGYSITLPFSAERSYRIESPSVTVGQYMIESTQLAGERLQLLQELAELQERLSGDLSPEAEKRAEKDAELLQSRLQALAEALTVPDEMQEDYLHGILGAAFDEMKANGEPFELVKLAASTVSVWVLQGREAAEDFWNNGGRHPNSHRRPQDRKARGRRKRDTSK